MKKKKLSPFISAFFFFTEVAQNVLSGADEEAQQETGLVANLTT